MLSAEQIKTIKRNFNIILNSKNRERKLSFHENGLVRVNTDIIGVYHTTNKQNEKEADKKTIETITLNCGDSEGKDQKIENLNRDDLILKYIQKHNVDVLILNDITFRKSLETYLKKHKYSWVYIPTLLKQNIVQSSGLLIITKGPILSGYLNLPNVVPQGKPAREEWLIALYHPILALQTQLKNIDYTLGSFYVSSYSRQSQRKKYQRIMLEEVQTFAQTNNSDEIILGGDGNAYGLVIPLPVPLWTYRFMLIVAAHLITTGFNKEKTNILNQKEIKSLRQLASKLSYQLLPKKWSPTITKSISIFGISFMLDYLYYAGSGKAESEVIPGIYPNNDHNGILTTIKH